MRVTVVCAVTVQDIVLMCEALEKAFTVRLNGMPTEVWYDYCHTVLCICAACAVMQCPTVRLSHWHILSNRINMSLKCLNVGWPHRSTFSI